MSICPPEASLRHPISAGAYEAVVTEVGGALHSLRHAGRALLCRDDSVVPVPDFSGAVLLPWPNRVDRGRYQYAGQTHQLSINEAAYGNAIHGLALWNRWRTVDASPSTVTMACTVCPQPGYPFQLAVSAHYSLDASSGLSLTVTTLNESEGRAPYGVSIHPYLLAGEGPVDEWTLSLDAAEVLEPDPERMIPISQHPVQGTTFDFRQPRPIGSAAIDHAYTDIAFAATGRAAARLTGPDGRGVEISWDERCRWVQVYTLDLPGSPLLRRAVAVEPMTCPADAFNSGTGLVELGPGERHEVTWGVSGFEAPEGAPA